MADPTSLPGTLQQIWSDMVAFGEGLQDYNEKARFGSYKRYFMKLAMQAAFAATPEAEVFITQNRKFLKNGGASDITIEGNGVEWVFPVGSVYAVSPEEFTYFTGKITELGIVGLTEALFIEWVVFAPESYFWS